MKLGDGVIEVASLAANEAAVGAGVISPTVYERANSIFSQEGNLSGLSKSLGVDFAGFFADGAIAIGMLQGLHRRLQVRMHREEGETLSQPAAFVLVDIHGRILGIEAMLFDIAVMLESATTQRLSGGMVRARMGTAFIMIEQVIAEASGELVKRNGFSEVAQSAERVASEVRSGRIQQYQEPLKAHLDELPA